MTGGATGIGFGIARRFVEAGANVVIADIDLAAAEAAAKKLAEASGRPWRCVSTSARRRRLQDGGEMRQGV